jgi:hypothetical protein
VRSLRRDAPLTGAPAAGRRRVVVPGVQGLLQLGMLPACGSVRAPEKDGFLLGAPDIPEP